MTSPESALVDILKGNLFSPAVSAVTAITTRIFWDKLPKDVVYPAIKLQRISTIRDDYRSINTGIADYAECRFQIDCWALTRLAALNLAQAVFETIEAAHGTFGDIRVDPCWVEDEAGDLEEGIGPSGVDVYRQRLDVFVPFAKLAA